MKLIFIFLIALGFHHKVYSQNSNIQHFDYIIESKDNVITAYPRDGAGLAEYSGADAYTVIQAAISAISKGAGGSIYITAGTYFLTNELIISGWDTDTPPQSQIVLTGNGLSTRFIQNTPDKNAIVVKNKTTLVFRDFYIYTGPNSKSGILLDDSGNSEISVWGGTIDNVFIQSNSTTQPAFYGKNFFDLDVPHLTAINNNNHAIILENTSKTINYGNSNFGLIRAVGSKKYPYAGLYLKSTNSKGLKFPNLMTFANYECSIAYRGIWMDGAKQNTFSFVDLEGLPQPIYLDGSAISGESRWNKFLSGYVLPVNGGTAITNTAFTGGNDFNLYIEDNAATIPISDRQTYKPANSYNIIMGGAGIGNIKIVSAANTPLFIRKNNGEVINHQPAVSANGRAKNK